MASPDLLTQIRGELDARLRELRPLLSEYERLLVAAEALALEDTPSPTRRRAATKTPAPAPKAALVSAPVVPVKPPTRRRRDSVPKRVQRGAAAVAIVAALEHGSHTVSELTIVTAMSGAIIQSNLRRLQQARTVTRTKRAGDGKAAYVLAAAPV